jgi:hypothetical protein
MTLLRQGPCALLMQDPGASHDLSLRPNIRTSLSIQIDDAAAVGLAPNCDAFLFIAGQKIFLEDEVSQVSFDIHARQSEILVGHEARVSRRGGGLYDWPTARSGADKHALLVLKEKLGLLANGIGACCKDEGDSDGHERLHTQTISRAANPTQLNGGSNG